MYATTVLSSLVLSASLAAALNLNVTALGAANGASTLECWQLESPFSISSQAGTAGSASLNLGDAANLTYAVIPAGFDGGLHNAPYNQWVAFVSGLAYITLPTNDSSEVYISGGEFGLIFAADLAGLSSLGHRTQYPSITETVALEIPTKDNVVPEHVVLHSGPCTAGEVMGLKGLATGGS